MLAYHALVHPLNCRRHRAADREEVELPRLVPLVGLQEEEGVRKARRVEPRRGGEKGTHDLAAQNVAVVVAEHGERLEGERVLGDLGACGRRRSVRKSRDGRVR